MGYHIVNLILKNSRVLNDRKILNGKILVLYPDEIIDVNDIEDIIID